MRILFICSIAALFTLPFKSMLKAQDIPAYFQGEIIAQGKKPAWLGDSRTVSFTTEEGLFLLNLEKGKTEKIAEMYIAEYYWLSYDSALVIEWPDNIAEKKTTSKIINYWIVLRNGKKGLLAADTSITKQIPKYKRPFSLPDGTVCIEKNPGWKESSLPQMGDFIALAPPDYDLERPLKKYRRLSHSGQERGSIHFKDINGETVKTLVMGDYYFDPRLSPDYSKFLAYSRSTMIVADSMGNILVDLKNYIDSTMIEDFDKFFGGVWNNNSDGFIYYEIYDSPEKLITINYFDLIQMRRVFLTRTSYYGKDSFRFSPDGDKILSHMNYNNKDFIGALTISTYDSKHEH